MPFDATAFHLRHPFLEVVGSDRLVTCASVELLLDGFVAFGHFGVVHILWKHVTRKVAGVVVVDNIDLGLNVVLLDLVVLLLQLQMVVGVRLQGFGELSKRSWCPWSSAQEEDGKMPLLCETSLVPAVIFSS